MDWEVKNCGSCGRKFCSEQDFFKNTSRWAICSQNHLWFDCNCQSTLVLTKGKYSWYSPDKHLSKDSSSVFNRVFGKKKIPHIDRHILSIRERLPRCADVIDVYPEIKKDPILSSQILRIVENIQVANQSDTNTQTSLKHALQILGKERLRSLIIPAFLNRIKIECKTFSTDEFWARSFQSAMISNLLAIFIGNRSDRDSLFLHTSLANIGILVNAIYFPELVDTTQEVICDPKTQDTWEKISTANGLYPSNIMGEIGAAIWGFSQQTINVISYHNQEEIPKHVSNREQIFLASLAIMLTSWIRGEPHLIESPLLKSRMLSMNINESIVEDFAAQIDLNFLNWR